MHTSVSASILFDSMNKLPHMPYWHVL